MGYYDSKGFYVYQETDAADPGAGFSELLNLSARALPAAVESLVEDLLSSDPTIRDAAVRAVEDALALGEHTPRKCVHKEGGKWVYDGPGGTLATHYLIPDHTGAYVPRPTPWPVPGATPALNW